MRTNVEATREYNRAYMRQWRARPENQVREAANRRKWHDQRKFRGYLEQLNMPKCFSCRAEGALTEIGRFAALPGRLIPVRVFWCGEC